MTHVDLNGAVLAVDGGGSQCRLALVLADGARSVVTVGPTNVTSDFSGACAVLNRGLADLAAKAGCALADLASVPAYLGLAGVTHDALAQRVAAAVPLHRVEVGEDQRIAVRAALGARTGAVAHCGTGSFFGVQQPLQQLAQNAAPGPMQLRLSGGWGLILGDEASAAWLGRRALRDSLAVVDGLRPGSGLSADLLQQLGPPEQIIDWAAKARPVDFGALAKRVTAAAQAGDDMARGIMQAGADHIATVLPRMGWLAGQPLCLTGGLGPQYGPYLPAAMQSALCPPQAEPLEGAVAMARDLAAHYTGLAQPVSKEAGDV